MRIFSLKKYQNLRSRKGDYFGDLPPAIRRRAEERLRIFRLRWAGRLPKWRFAILVGRARTLALNPPDSAWGRRMLSKRGGYAVQRKYRLEGRTPTAKATEVRAMRRGAKVRTGSELHPTARRVAIAFPWEIGAHTGSKILSPPPSAQAHHSHKLFDPPNCVCYYCAWPNHQD